MTHTPFCNILQLLSKRPHLTLKRSLIISLSHTLRIHDRHSTSIDQKAVFFDIFVYNSQLMKTPQRFRKAARSSIAACQASATFSTRMTLPSSVM